MSAAPRRASRSPRLPGPIPDQAARFVAATRVDWLAVAVGNVHGGSPAEGGLQRQRLRAIAEAVNVPLVLHGASGLGGDDLRYAVGQRVAKINVGTSLHEAFARGMADGPVGSTVGSAPCAAGWGSVRAGGGVRPADRALGG